MVAAGGQLRVEERFARRFVRLIGSLGLLGVVVSLAGCGNFFVPPGSSGGGGSTTTNRVYVANATTGTISGFTTDSNKLTAVTGSPMSLGYVPLAAVVTPNNKFLYVASLGAIYVYTINTDGSLAAPSSGAAVAAVNVTALDVSPDGQWLFGLDSTTTALDEFQIDNSTGQLSVVGSTPYSVASGTILTKDVKVSPAGNLVFIALGTAGDVVFTLNTTTGAVVNSQTLAPVSKTSSDNALAIDSTGSYLYIARSGTGGGLAVYSIGAGGALNSISGSPFSAGTQPWSIVIDSTGKYIYVANRSDGTISGYGVGTGSTLTALSGSPYTSGTLVTSLAVDKSGTYLLAGANGGNPDLSMYTFDTTTAGKLNLATSVATDTDPAGVVAIAVTH